MLFIVIFLLLIIMFFNKRNKKAVEGYHDITPYDFHWDMFKCLDMDCLKNKTKKCYDWCNNWGESGGRHNCRMRCLDYADQYAEQLKFNNYNFNRILPKFKWAALHRDKWYNWRKFSQ